MNYEPFEDGRRVVESVGANPYEMPHNFPKLFHELRNDCMVIKEASGWLCFCHCSNSCEAPLRVLVHLVLVQEALPGSLDESANLSAPFMALEYPWWSVLLLPVCEAET